VKFSNTRYCTLQS